MLPRLQAMTQGQALRHGILVACMCPAAWAALV